MLVLTRKRFEQVVIGDDIAITVLAVSGSRVKLGFDCPRDIAVHRRGLCDRLETADGVIVPRVRPAGETLPYSGWVVVYATGATDHPCVKTFLCRVTQRYPGLRAFAEFRPYDNVLEVVPPDGLTGESIDRMDDEVNDLLQAIHRRPRDPQDD